MTVELTALRSYGEPQTNRHMLPGERAAGQYGHATRQIEWPAGAPGWALPHVLASVTSCERARRIMLNAQVPGPPARTTRATACLSYC
jgi:hypothetical protein